MKIIRHIVLFAVVVVMVCGCRRQPAPELMRLYELTETAPAEALAQLDSLNTDNLGEADRHFADFVRLKASDKAYITHASDSTILTLLDYYEVDDRFGSEVLYYAGRVYSDLGDYPTALTYFQKALQITPIEKNPRLRGTISSQIGRLLNTIKLHTQAIPYLKETLHIDSLMNDTVNLMYDHQLLGAIYMRANIPDSAEMTFIKGMAWAQYLTEEETSLINCYFAHLAYMQGEYKKALELIRDVPEKQPPISRNLPMLYATQIYRANGELDSAYHYVDALIHSNYYMNRCAGFEELFSTDLRNLIPKDSLSLYLTTYNQLLDYAAANNSAENAIFQNTYFNYNNHLEKRIEAEKSKNVLLTYVVVISLVCILLVLCFIYTKYVHQRNLLELHQALKDISELKQLLEEKTAHDKEDLNSPTDLKPESQDILGQNSGNSNDDLIETLRKELMALSKRKDFTKQNEILNSNIYKKISEILSKNKSIPEDSNLWNELEDHILSLSPDFKQRFQLILGKKLSKQDLQTMLLIKCGFKNNDIACLVGRHSSTISERRKTLCKRIFGKDVGIKVFNDIIANL